MTSTLSRLKSKIVLLYSQCTLQEISGGLGDLGTLLPLLIAMSTQRSISLAPALFFGGLSNVITGYLWDVPMCVQPMKSIAAVALSEGWNKGTVTAAGIWAGLFTLLLGISSLIEVVNKIVPRSVVSGLQIGVGIRLASKGVSMVSALSWANGYDCILVSIICSILCLYWFREPSISNTECTHVTSPNDGNEKISFCEKLSSRKQHTCNRNHPVGVYLFLIGGVFASITLGTTNNENNEYDLPLRAFGASIAKWAIADVTSKDWKVGLLEGALPQLPLTTLNSVIAVCALAQSLYPEKKREDAEENSTDAVISRKDVAISVGLMNLVFVPFGSMPNCHGAGGLAGQHRFGARHGSSVVFLGICKMAIAIFFGASALTLLDSFPDAILGLMLVIAGHELSTQGFMVLVKSVDNKPRSSNTESEALEIAQSLRQNTTVTLITTIVIVSSGKTHFGALSGIVAHMIYGRGINQFMEWLQFVRKSKTEDTSGEVPSPSVANEREHAYIQLKFPVPCTTGKDCSLESNEKV
jgi:hypothetical protein